MKHGVAFRKLSRTSSHRDMLLRNLVSSLLEHGQIKTTVAKAKETARLAEKIITLGKRGDAWARTRAQAFLFKPEITLPLLFDDYAQRYATRPGGYTRIHPYGNRSGDNAPHAIIELVDGPHDLKFEMTARAVGRETVEAALANAAGPSSSGVAFSDIGTALRYRSDEDRQRFRKIAADWANRLLTEPLALKGLRHQTQRIPPAEDPGQSKGYLPRPKPPKMISEGKKVFAGERLLGMRPAKGTSPLSVARGRLGHPRKNSRSKIWDEATRDAIESSKARGPNTL